MYFFATYFDSNYLPRALLLIESLNEHVVNYKMFILCMDEKSYEFLENYDGRLVPTMLSDFESTDESLIRAKNNRSRIEYYFTLTSCWCTHVLQVNAEISYLSYLDSDLFFYGKIDILFKEMGDRSVFIIPHNFSDKNDHLNIYGRYNVGFIAWKNDTAGLKCLKDWRDKCLEWCYDRLEEDRFADQKYLDKWPENKEFNVKVSSNVGLNAAYYNIGHQSVVADENSVLINDQVLVFYHFHKIKQVGRRQFIINLADEAGYKNKTIISLYSKYLKKLNHIESQFGLKSNSIRYIEKKTSLTEWLTILFFEHSLIITSIGVWHIHLQDQLSIIYFLYRSLKGLYKKLVGLFRKKRH